MNNKLQTNKIRKIIKDNVILDDLCISKIEFQLKQLEYVVKENQQLKEDLEKSIKVQIKTNKILIELERLTKNYFQGKTIEDIPKDDYYNKGKYRMVEWFLEHLNELKDSDIK